MWLHRIASFIDGIVSYLNKTDNKSLLKIRYSRKNIFPIGVAWITGASVMGFLGSFLQLTANTPTAMGTIGISWPFIFSKMVGSLGEKEDEVDDNLLEEEFDDFDEDLDESENSDDIMNRKWTSLKNFILAIDQSLTDIRL